MKRIITISIGLALIAGSAAAGTRGRTVEEIPGDAPVLATQKAPGEAKRPASLAETCATCGPSFRPGNSLSIQGSTTLRPIVDRVNQTVEIQDGIRVTGRNLGSTTGIRCVIEGECQRRGTWTANGPCDMGNDGVVGTNDGPCDIGISSRAVTATEIGFAQTNNLCLVEHPVAIDGLGLIVNNDPACSTQFPLLGGLGLADYLVANLPGPPLGGLSETQVKEILFGNDASTLGGVAPIFQQWCDLVGCANGALPNITIVSRQEEGGTYGAFLDLYVCNTLDSTPRPAACTSAPLFPRNTGSNVDPFEWLRKPSSCNPTSCGVNDPPVVNPLLGSSPTQFVGSNDEVVAGVANTCGGFGYAGISFIETALAAGARVKSFPVTQTLAQPPVAATFATTLDNTFDFTRKLFAYTIGTPYGQDPRSIYLDTLFARVGQANVFEAGFVPANGVRVRNAGFGVVDQAQVVLEPVGRDLIRSSAGRIETRLALVLEAEATLADPMATPAQKRDATTDLIESEFSIRETVDENNALVDRLIARVEGCLAGGSCANPAGATVVLDAAIAEDAAAQAFLVPNDPMTPIEEFIKLSNFPEYLRALERAFAHAQDADRACNH